jgi:hypothetical protein
MDGLRSLDMSAWFSQFGPTDLALVATLVPLLAAMAFF